MWGFRILILFSLVILTGCQQDFGVATRVLTTQQGGTGTGTPQISGLLYSDASNQWAVLPPGSDGQVLKLASGVPGWGTDATGGGGGGGGYAEFTQVGDNQQNASTTPFKFANGLLASTSQIFSGGFINQGAATNTGQTNLGSSLVFYNANSNINGLGDITFQTGATGGTVRTGTSNADKFVLQGYDVDGAAYVDIFEVDAANDPHWDFKQPPRATTGLNASTTSNFENINAYGTVSGAGFNNFWDSRFNATTTWHAFQSNWNTAFNATTTWAHFTTNFNNLFNATTTFGGNSQTATALAANGTNASAGNAILGVDASGNAEGAFDVWTEAENTAAGYGKNDWRFSGTSAITPTTTVGILVNASSTIIGNFKVDGNATNTGNLVVGNDSATGEGKIKLAENMFLAKDTSEGYLVVADDSTLANRLFTVDTSGNSTTTGWFNIGTTNVGATLGPRIGPGDLLVGRNATTTGNLSVGGFASTTKIILQPGSVSLPALTFAGDEDTGLFSSGANILNLVVAGATEIQISSTAITANEPFLQELSSTASAPQYSFNGDSNTGLFRDTADVLSFATGGVTSFNVGNAYASTTGFLNIGTSKGTLTLGTGDLLVGRNATTTGDLEIVGGDVNASGGALNFWGIITAKLGAIINAFLQIPNGAGGTTVDAAGEITIDTTSRTFNFHDGTAEVVLNPEVCASANIVSATTTDELLRIGKFFPSAVTISKVTLSYTCDYSAGGCASGTTFNFKHATDISSDGTTNNLFTSTQTMTNNASTTPESFTTGFGDATVPANSHLWINPITASTTQMTNLHASICYRQDP